MKICRGSGVIQKTKDGWKIKHYVLSMTVPNENVDEVVKVKSKIRRYFTRGISEKLKR